MRSLESHTGWKKVHPQLHYHSESHYDLQDMGEILPKAFCYQGGPSESWERRNPTHNPSATELRWLAHSPKLRDRSQCRKFLGLSSKLVWRNPGK